jgi:hypothetical protein
MLVSPPLRSLVLVGASLAVLLVPLGSAGGVRIVDSSGQRNFADIQPAIDAAVDGDVLLVGAGNYAGFALDAKSLWIVAVPAGAQEVTTGNITLQNQVGGPSVLCGFSAGVLTVANCSAHVVLQSCSFAAPTYQFSGLHHRVDASSRVVLAACELIGGPGLDCSACPIGNRGSNGLTVSSSVVAAYDCTFRGGPGGYTAHDTGNGGHGLELEDGAWFCASGCSFFGGASGDGPTCGGGQGAWCGFAGYGLYARPGCEFRGLSSSYAGGLGGSGCCASIPGAPYDCPGTCDFLPGAARVFDLAYLSADRAPWSVSVTGIAGDQVFLERSTSPVFQYEPSLSGVCTSVLPPFATGTPAGILPATGSLRVSVRQRLLPDGLLARPYYLQGRVIESGGATVLGSPLHVLSLDWNSLPDCNANGIQDYAEVIAGITPDADHDLVPDGCP